VKDIVENVLNNRYKNFDESLESGDIFENALNFEVVDQLRQSGLYPYYKIIQLNDGPVALIDGKETIMLGSNNYQGLTTHPEVRKASAEAVMEYGTSMTGSRLFNGTTPFHEALEEELADFVEKDSALVFATGYQSNVGAISAVLAKGTYAVVDRFCHASIHDAIRVGKGEPIKFNHNDMADLERVLKELPRDRGRIILVDGVYSMEGDLARLEEIVEMAKRYNARLYVDDAHGIGVLGKGGKGTCDHFNLTNKVDLIMGTFSKSLASIGGFVAGDRKIIDYIKHVGRSILFSASLAPGNVAAVRKALEIIRREPERAELARNNGKRLKNGLEEAGFPVGQTQAPIVPVMIGDELKTLMMWKDLLAEGVFVNPVLYPACPRDGALFRTSTMVSHTGDHIDMAVEKIAKVGRKHEVIQ
jgi:8-amino-7-oxononanoate synthase